MSLRNRGYVSEGEKITIKMPGPPEYKEGAHKAESFVNKVRSVGQPHPFFPGMVFFDDSIMLEISTYPSGFPQHKDTVYFSSVMAVEPGKGLASRAMKRLLGMAQDFGVAIEGTVKPIGSGGLNKRQLMAWYKRLGFKANGSKIRWEPR